VLKRLAIIPARSGSKGLPGKNLAEINGESLVARAVRCARETEMFTNIIVSSDDIEIIRSANCEPHLRPPHLATDDANIEDTIEDILRIWGKFDVVALLQPTSPTRTPEIVRECVGAIDDDYFDAAMTVAEVPVKYHGDLQMGVAWCEQGGEVLHPRVINRQSVCPRYIKDGLCYAVRTESFHKYGLFGQHCKVALVTYGRPVNIDTPEDLEEARRLLG
jgi:CMP-N,N'-diacetyllegionaminic acid synthase